MNSHPRSFFTRSIGRCLALSRSLMRRTLSSRALKSSPTLRAVSRDRRLRFRSSASACSSSSVAGSGSGALRTTVVRRGSGVGYGLVKPELADDEDDDAGIVKGSACVRETAKFRWAALRLSGRLGVYVDECGRRRSRGDATDADSVLNKQYRLEKEINNGV
jgi:hypothetical protein